MKHCAFIILAITATVQAEDTADYLAQHRSYLRSLETRYVAELAKANSAEHIKSCEEMLKNIRWASADIERELHSNHLEVGTFGVIPDREVKVFQIVDERNFLCKFWDRLVWVSGVSTSDLVDGQELKLKQVFKVTGTKRYESAGGGSNTVHLLEVFDTTDADVILEKERAENRRAEEERKEKEEELRKAEAERLRKARTREFTDLTGKFKVVAEYCGYDQGLVILRRTDTNKKLTIPLGKLSDKDRAWVSSMIAKKR